MVAIPPRLADVESANALVGRWMLHRHLFDRRHGIAHLFIGSAVGTLEPDGLLRWREDGELRSPGVTLQAFRTTWYAPTGTGRLRLLLESGETLGILEPAAGRGRLSHDCADDRYRGAIVRVGGCWWTRWRCQGPAKDYVTTTIARPARLS